MTKGFTCECGEEHTFPAYVFAHWTEVITHTCDGCSREHDIQRGVAALTKPKRAKR